MGLCCGPRSGKVAAQKRTGLQPEFYLHFKISGNCWESPRYLELPVFGLRLVGGVRRGKRRGGGARQGAKISKKNSQI